MNIRVKNTLSAESQIHKKNIGKSKAFANLYEIAGEEWRIKNTKPQDTFICLQSLSDCAVYYRCVHGMGVRYEFGLGLLWNSENGLCDWSHSVQC